MKNNLLLILAVGLVCCFKVNAQQEPMFTHYMFNKLTYNPAYAGSRDAICATLVYHNQWTGFDGPDKEGAPITQNFAIHAPIKVGDKADLGVGFHITNDKSGFIGTTGFWGSVAYKKKLSFAELGLGLNAGLAQQTLGATWRMEHPNDKRLPNKASSSVFDAGAGVYLNALNWYAGVSALHLTAANAKWVETGGNTVDYKITPCYFLTGGYNMPLNANFELQPSFIVKTDFAKTVADVTALALYKQKIWGGLNYRAERITALSAMVGIYPFANLSIGYSYDIATIAKKGDPNPPFGGSHEIMANYCFKIGLTPKEDVWHKSPRFL
ncbi:MAG: PorP/SprF family type IX secretion system membrane protein [Bacteroidia bacterium]